MKCHYHDRLRLSWRNCLGAISLSSYSVSVVFLIGMALKQGSMSAQALLPGVSMIFVELLQHRWPSLAYSPTSLRQCLIMLAGIRAALLGFIIALAMKGR